MGCRIPKPVAIAGWPLRGNDVPVYYAYQATFAENELALNWSLFDLSSNDGLLGRFHSPDPMRQYASPYIAMGNNTPVAASTVTSGSATVAAGSNGH